MREVVEVGLFIISSLGGGVAIVFSLSNFFGKLWANKLMAKETAQHSRDLESLRSQLLKDTESYKIKLKKSELIFEKEFEAASEFVSLIRGFTPTFGHPHMEWYEACDEIAYDFEKIEPRLDGFLSKHGAVLPEDVKDGISECIAMAGQEKFEIDSFEIPLRSNKVADDLFNKLWECENKMLAHVKSQASI